MNRWRTIGRMCKSWFGDFVSGRPQMMSIISPCTSHYLGNRPLWQRVKEVVMRNYFNQKRSLQSNLFLPIVSWSGLHVPIFFFCWKCSSSQHETYTCHELMQDSCQGLHLGFINRVKETFQGSMLMPFIHKVSSSPWGRIYHLPDHHQDVQDFAFLIFFMREAGFRKAS